jgi:hypothetical protein
MNPRLICVFFEFYVSPYTFPFLEASAVDLCLLGGEFMYLLHQSGFFARFGLSNIYNFVIIGKIIFERVFADDYVYAAEILSNCFLHEFRFL